MQHKHAYNVADLIKRILIFQADIIYILLAYTKHGHARFKHSSQFVIVFLEASHDQISETSYQLYT